MMLIKHEYIGDGLWITVKDLITTIECPGISDQNKIQLQMGPRTAITLKRELADAFPDREPQKS
jgi:hypothetical protein